MANPWDDLKEEVLDALREGIEEFATEIEVPETEMFLREKAEALAREKWAEVHAATEDERELARSNMRHLRGQIAGEIARLQLAASERAGAVLKKVIETAVGVLIRVGPSALGL